MHYHKGSVIQIIPSIVMFVVGISKQVAISALTTYIFNA